MCIISKEYIDSLNHDQLDEVRESIPDSVLELLEQLEFVSLDTQVRKDYVRVQGIIQVSRIQIFFYKIMDLAQQLPELNITDVSCRLNVCIPVINFNVAIKENK